MMMTGLINLLLVIVIFGVLIGLINRYIPMPALIKSLINLLAFVILILYVLQSFNLIPAYFPMIEWIHLPNK